MIADSQSIPSRYLEEIIGELRKAGLVVGKRGPRGGYRLAKPASDIAVSEVLRALQTSVGQGGTGRPDDEITALVERSVDDQLQSAVSEMRLDQLLEQALDRHRRSAANYMI